MRRLIDAPSSDISDVFGYIRFTLAPLARAERAKNLAAALRSRNRSAVFRMRAPAHHLKFAIEIA